MDIVVSSSGVLKWNGKEYKCAIGKNGMTQEKSEGDGTTPIGCFPIREVLYRADKLPKPVTDLPISIIQKNDGWCDEIDDSNYNKKITLPFSVHHENLWRNDTLYDIVVILGYNDDPVVSGKGSAIFMHIARQSYSPTEGCIALSVQDLISILETISPETRVCIES